jgi:hypothetical protein
MIGYRLGAGSRGFSPSPSSPDTRPATTGHPAGEPTMRDNPTREGPSFVKHLDAQYVETFQRSVFHIENAVRQR